MDFLNRAYSQLSDLYRSMTPGSRLTAGLLASVVVLSMGYVWMHPASAPDVDLMHGIPIAASQLPMMEAAFAKANLKGHEIRGSSIYVPRGQETAYMAALVEAKALPQNFGDALREAVNSANPFENSRTREQRTKVGMQDTLALIIGKMPGVENAYVLYDIESKPAFNKEKVMTATACVKPVGSSQLNEAQVSNIRYLVVGVIAGLKPENVTVSDLNGRTWRWSPDEQGGVEKNRYITLKQTYEQDLKAKILNALCYIPNVTVETNVELAPERAASARPPRRTAKDRLGSHNETNLGNKDSHVGSAEAASQQPNTAAVLVEAILGGSRGKDDATAAGQPGVGSDEQAEKQNDNLTPVSAKASIGVPISYFRKVWQERNPVEPGHAARVPDQAALDQIRGEVSATIQRHVAQLLPMAREDTVKAAELVAVTTFQDLPTQELPTPGFSQDLLSWVRQSWQTLGMIVLALVSLLVLRSIMGRESAASDAEPVSRDVNLDSDVDVGRPAEVPPPHAQRFYRPSPAARESLSELIEDDPDAAAKVLRNWIGSAG